MNRRRFLRCGAGVIAGLGLTGCPRPPTEAPRATPAPTPAASYPITEPITEVVPGTILHNEDRPGFFIRFIRPLPAPDRAAWRLIVDGLVEVEMTLAMPQLQASLTYKEQNTRMVCVEGWSSRATWGGFTYASLAALVKPQSAATHVRFECADGYWESLPIAELHREGALFVTHMNGAWLPAPHGAPLRIILPWLYGYKGAKTIVRLTFSDKLERGYWPSVGPYTVGGRIQPGRDFPLDLPGAEVRTIGDGEVTAY